LTSIIELNDKDKLDIEFIGSLLRINKFLVSKKISTKVSFTRDKIIYLTKKKKEFATVTFYKNKTGLFTKYYDLEIRYALPGNNEWNLFSFYEREVSEINDREYDYGIARFDKISLKKRNFLSKNIVLFFKMIFEVKKLTKNQSFKIWKKTGISSKEFVDSMFYRFDGK
jgi:hypothetical protein